MGIREMLMGTYALAWLFVVLLTAWRTGSVPAELWAGLGVGEGALLALFRADDALRRQREQLRRRDRED